MKVKFYCNSGANIHSCRTDIVDLNDWDITDEEWGNMPEDDKYKIVEQWANERLEIGWEQS